MKVWIGAVLALLALVVGTWAGFQAGRTAASAPASSGTPAPASSGIPPLDGPIQRPLQGLLHQPSVLATSLPAHELAKGEYARWDRPGAPSRVVVVTHSFSDRTHVVAGETARMLGATYVRLHEAPEKGEFTRPSAERTEAAKALGASTFEEAVAALSAPDVEVVFLGSPIWGGPTKLAARLAEAAALQGKLVVPFCTHLQQFDVAKMEAHLDLLRRLGARVARPWIVRVPLDQTADDILRLVWQSLPARTDLWWGRESASPRCGASASGLETCLVPAGTAWVWTPTPSREGSTVYVRSPLLVSVPAFEVTRAEIPIATFGAGRSPAKSQLTRVWNSTCRELVGDRLDLPMPCVSFDEAQTWCADHGMRLPTLAEWTRAARGDLDQPYPWGRTFAYDGRLGNFGEATGSGRVESGCNQEGVAFESDGFPGLAPGCSFPGGASLFGVCDLAGNLAEWVATTSPGGGVGAALAGGTWFDCEPGAWRVDRTAFWLPGNPFDGIGFRCTLPVSEGAARTRP